MQLSAIMPNFLLAECFINLEEFGREIAVTPFEVTNGYVDLPDTPGLGIDLDVKALNAHPYMEAPR